MSTVRRDFLSSPQRTGTETWDAISAIIAADSDSAARKELDSVAGIAAQLISTESAKDYPIICHGSGPRVRIYCVYNNDAVDPENANESALAFNATEKDWKVSLPAEEDDVTWASAELAKLTKRITVRLKTDQIDDADEESTSTATASLKLDLGKFLKQ